MKIADLVKLLVDLINFLNDLCIGVYLNEHEVLSGSIECIYIQLPAFSEKLSKSLENIAAARILPP